jgi:hypothetical protein
VKKTKEYIYLVFIIGLTTFIVDITRGGIDSYLNSFIALMNVVVIGYLTYFIFKVNEQMANISKDNLRVTKFQIKQISMSQTNSLLGKLDEYMNSNEIIRMMTLPHLSTNEKLKILMEKGNHRLDDEIVKCINGMADMKLSMGVGSEEEKTASKYISNIFSNTIPNSVFARYDFKDALSSYDNVKSFNSDMNFYRFKKNSELIKPAISFLELKLNEILKSNDKETSFSKLNINQYDANLIYGFTMQIDGFLNNLKEIITEEQNEIIENTNI